MYLAIFIFPWWRILLSFYIESTYSVCDIVFWKILTWRWSNALVCHIVKSLFIILQFSILVSTINFSDSLRLQCDNFLLRYHPTHYLIFIKIKRPLNRFFILFLCKVIVHSNQHIMGVVMRVVLLEIVTDDALIFRFYSSVRSFWWTIHILKFSSWWNFHFYGICIITIQENSPLLFL